MASLIVLVGSFVVLRLPGLEIGTLDGWQPALRGALAAMFLFTGVAHFGTRRANFIKMVPPRLPSPALLVTVTGVLELTGSVGTAPRADLPAGSGLPRSPAHRLVPRQHPRSPQRRDAWRQARHSAHGAHCNAGAVRRLLPGRRALLNACKDCESMAPGPRATSWL